MRGGALRSVHMDNVALGLSPHARGSPGHLAGRPTVSRVYPRMRGGAWIGSAGGLIELGSIPACAGEPSTTPPGRSPRRVYPRRRGGAASRWAMLTDAMGLSPHARGSLGGDSNDAVGCGSIPACAGEPATPARRPRRSWVYPRMRGGAAPHSRTSPYGEGLSPHARGSLEPLGLQRPDHGSIPRMRGGAYAYDAADRALDGLSPHARGEPGWVLWFGAWAGVYPRMRGGAYYRCLGGCGEEGLSRMRGGARTWPGRGDLERVYPRMRGGAWRRCKPSMAGAGLSPHARGSPRWRAAGRAFDGSIPACAGEPARPPAASRRRRVYPRMRGGATARQHATAWATGLSPHARGSL